METTIDIKASAQKLIELRGERSQKEVADALGISISALSMYENGERIPLIPITSGNNLTA